jgi:hypothetical protein
MSRRAVESTGVYWIAAHEVLAAHGLKVLMVDTRQLARVPGRDKKTDPTDCEWIQRLHSCGLLRGWFRPAAEICMLRTPVRDKVTQVAESGDWVRRMQKSPDQMNVRVHRAVGDISGTTGMAVIRAIAETRAGRPETGAPARSVRSQKRGGNHRTVDRALAGRPLVQPVPGAEDVRSDRGANLCLYEKEILRKPGEMEREGQEGKNAPPLKNTNKARRIKKRRQEPKR